MNHFFDLMRHANRLSCGSILEDDVLMEWGMIVEEYPTQTGMEAMIAKYPDREADIRIYGVVWLLDLLYFPVEKNPKIDPEEMRRFVEKGMDLVRAEAKKSGESGI